MEGGRVLSSLCIVGPRPPSQGKGITVTPPSRPPATPPSPMRDVWKHANTSPLTVFSKTWSAGFLQSFWQYFWLPNFDISGDVGWCHSIFENMQTPSHPNNLPTESGIIVTHSSILLKVIARLLDIKTAVVEIEASKKRAKVETENQFWLKSGRGNEDVWPILAGSKNLWTLYSANEAVWPTIPRSFKTFHLKCFSY